MRGMLWMLGGAALGAGTALLFAPTTGRRARALIRDRFAKAGHDFAGATGAKARHMGNVMQGWQHRVESAVQQASQFMHEATGAEQETAAAV